MVYRVAGGMTLRLCAVVFGGPNPIMRRVVDAQGQGVKLCCVPVTSGRDRIRLDADQERKVG